MRKQGREIVLRVLAASLFLFLTLGGGCSAINREPKIYLSRLQPYPVSAASSERPIAIAVAVEYSPEATINRYAKIADYLSVEIGKTFTLMITPTAEEANDLVRTGAASLALVSSGAYVEGQREFGMQLIVVPEIGGKTTDYSFIIVPNGSPSWSLYDLKDTTFACTFPLSETGRLAPSYVLQQQGSDLETFFHRYSYTGSSEKSIKAIAEFLFDGAAVNSRAYDEMSLTEPETVRRTRIIERLGPYANGPVVVPPFLDGELKEKMREALLSANQSEGGREALRAMGVNRLVTVQDSAYDSVREMAKKVWWTR